MRILFLTNAFSNLSETFIYDRAVLLQKRGHDVHVVTERRLMERERPFEPVVVLRRAPVLPTLAGYCRHDLVERLKQASGDADAAPRSSSEIRCLEDLRAVAQRLKPDYIHAEFGRMGVLASHLAPALPLVVFMHGFDITAVPRRLAWRRRYSKLWRTGATILTPSEFMRQKVIALGARPDQVFVQQNGIDLGAWSYSDPAARFDGTVSFLFVGRLVAKKGPREMIAAFARMRQIAPEIVAELRLCGSGPLEDKVRSDIERLKLGGAVRLLGAVSSGEVRQAMARAHIMLQHSVETADGNMEGLPVSLTEAAASGLPIIATRHSGIPEIVEDGVSGFLVPEHDIEAMARRMADLARTPARWSDFGRAGRRRVEEVFASDAAIARYERLVQRRIFDQPIIAA